VASTILAGATGSFASDYPLAGDIGRYRYRPGDGARKAALVSGWNIPEHTLLAARHQSRFRRPLFNAGSSH